MKDAETGAEEREGATAPGGNPPLIAVVGCTAVGKTDLGIALARSLGGEIISADSRQVYRYMDIGTAKPTPEQRAAAPHHLVDVVDPDEEFSLARYQELALEAMDEMRVRGRVPLLVGGTGQYVQAVLEGWQVPRVAPRPELRAELARTAEVHGAETLHRRLMEVDPAAAAAIGPTNVRRMIRALEVYAVTGRPISEQQRKSPPPYHIYTVWLDMPRVELYQRIDRRVDLMIEAGLLDEVRALLAHGYRWGLPALSSLGYKEFRPWIEGMAALPDCIQSLKWNTHAFARRQTAWFKRLPHVRRVTAGPSLVADVQQLLRDEGLVEANRAQSGEEI
ncbi:MAG: tRNA dimethylallyltransferase [uncultured Chloroflexia bacterium]|uniref:tRNA dimethylallyltransferase n=1 Tax=uncultured Chloroflexia bacterium TaxID=1672391 RepID=A0A6J4HTV0_9CHLR|nr:MAG: tRNA dimethylallyltransferase [uncultured Chloroflexia bacterium]